MAALPPPPEPPAMALGCRVARSRPYLACEARGALTLADPSSCRRGHHAQLGKGPGGTVRQGLPPTGPECMLGAGVQAGAGAGGLGCQHGCFSAFTWGKSALCPLSYASILALRETSRVGPSIRGSCVLIWAVSREGARI